MRSKAARKSEGKVGKYVVHINGGGKTRTREFGNRDPALKLAEARDAQGLLVSVVNR